ncbi:hypothetical protein B0H11DRAFT_1993172 [Mycena galericulata]|nr:hypothetical protein B0H11DRAFT_1993172 [Mycena galericulata]
MNNSMERAAQALYQDCLYRTAMGINVPNSRHVTPPDHQVSCGAFIFPLHSELFPPAITSILSIDPQGRNCEAFQTLHRSGYVVADQLLGKEQYPLLALLFQLPNLPTIMAFYSQRYQCSASDAAFRVLQARLAFCPTTVLAVISQQIEAFSGMVEAVGEWDDGEWRSCLAQECTNLVAQEKYGREIVEYCIEDQAPFV